MKDLLISICISAFTIISCSDDKKDTPMLNLNNFFAEETSILINWNPIPNATNYQLILAKDEEFNITIFDELISSSQTNFTFQTLIPSTYYYLKINHYGLKVP